MTHPTIRDTSSAPPEPSTSTVLEAFRILDLFSGRRSELSLSEISSRLGRPKSSAHRLATDLVRAGALEKTEAGYRLGMRLFEYGTLVPHQRRIRDAALPFLQDLREVTHLTANLATRDGSEIVYIEKLVSRSTVVPHTRFGGRLPVHCTGLGKAMLAFAAPGDVDDVLSGELRRSTPRTITDTAVLRRELASIRRTRLAFDNEESELGLFCVAAPVFASQGVVAAISVTGATAREQTEQIAGTVFAVGRALSRSLGGS